MGAQDRARDIEPQSRRMLARLKWLACPLMAALLWQEGHAYIATVALAWPALLLVLLTALHLLHPASALPDAQRKFLLATEHTGED